MSGGSSADDTPPLSLLELALLFLMMAAVASISRFRIVTLWPRRSTFNGVQKVTEGWREGWEGEREREREPRAAGALYELHGEQNS